MQVQIHRSEARGDAPHGYVIARVVLAPGLFVDAESNRFTDYEFRAFALYRGQEDADEGECENLAWFDDPQGELARAFEFVRGWQKQ